ncbi:MAG: hypothetical protein AAGA91_17085 [Pseudomonadota bacterium]
MLPVVGLKQRAVAMCALSAVLVACGGGGSSESQSQQPDPDAVLTGQLVPAVEGMAYSTPSLSGTTDAQGVFRFRPGESVEFTIGATSLGSVPAEETVTMFDLAGSTAKTSRRDLLEAVATPSWSNSGLDFTLSPPETRWRAFHAAMNRLYVLGSLDRDQNPGNGVQIAPATVELLADTRLRFTQNWRAFRDQLAIRRARTDGQEAGAFSVPLAPVDYPAILDAAYAAQGVDPRIANMTRQYYFEDSGIDYVYDDNDRLIRREGWEYLEIRYDAFGNRIWQLDKCGQITETQYDALGNPTSRSDPFFLESWQYDRYGSLEAYARVRRSNGALEDYKNVALDALSQPVRIEEGRGGELFRVEESEYDERGNRIRWEQRRGDSVEMHVNRFDNQNRLVWRERRTGVEHTQQEWEYGASGAVIASSKTVFENGERTLDDRQRFDARGRVTWWERELYGESPGLRVVTRSWSDEGYETERTVDEQGDGVPDEITTWIRDAGGQIVSTQIDRDGDGTTDEVFPSNTRYEYDDRGNRLLLESTDADGRINWLTLYQYDDDNNLVLEDEQVGFYGLTTRYEYRTTGWIGIFYPARKVDEQLLFDEFPCLN